MKRFLALVLVVGSVLAAPLQPLPSVPTLPEGSRIDIVGQDLKVKHASGVISKRTLTLIADKSRLPSMTKINLWIAVPYTDVRNFSGTATRDGKDVILEIGREKVSFADTLEDIYNIKLEWKAP
jgi:hypothetical protein